VIIAPESLFSYLIEPEDFIERADSPSENEFIEKEYYEKRILPYWVGAASIRRL